MITPQSRESNSSSARFSPFDLRVTIATYQVVTRKSKGEDRALELFDSRDWGLIIYDEVHLLPAPVFRMTSDLQSRRRTRNPRIRSA